VTLIQRACPISAGTQYTCGALTVKRISRHLWKKVSRGDNPSGDRICIEREDDPAVFASQSAHDGRMRIRRMLVKTRAFDQQAELLQSGLTVAWLT